MKTTPTIRISKAFTAFVLDLIQTQMMMYVLMLELPNVCTHHLSFTYLHLSTLFQIEDEMIQCIVCEDWFHGRVCIILKLTTIQAAHCYALLIKWVSLSHSWRQAFTATLEEHIASQ